MQIDRLPLAHALLVRLRCGALVAAFLLIWSGPVAAQLRTAQPEGQSGWTRKELVRARDLSEALEVSERTIYRDIQDLITSGVPIEGEARALVASVRCAHWAAFTGARSGP